MSHLLSFSDEEISKKLGHKIIIAGLAEAGKTSTKRIFFLKQKSKEVKNLPATLNYERMSIIIKNVPLTIIDLGGQKIFLHRFLTRMSPFIFSNVKVLIFVIDVNNKTTQNSAIEYFSKSVERLHTYSPKAKYFILLHKNDLVINSPNYESIHEQLKERFQLVGRIKLFFFRTSIYKPETIINCLGRIIELTMPDIAESDFVDHKSIGEIEESIAKFVILRGDFEDEKRNSAEYNGDTSPIESNELLNLQKLMQTGLTQANADSEGNISSNKSLMKLKMMMQQGITNGLTSDSSSGNLSTQPSIKTTFESASKNNDSDINDFLTTGLVNFYGIHKDQALEIVKNGYHEIFGSAVSAGIPLELGLKIFLNFIPRIKTLPNLSLEGLNKKNLLNVFILFTQNTINENDIFDCLIMIAENPQIDINNIKEQIKSFDKIKYEKLLNTFQYSPGGNQSDFHSRILSRLPITVQARINKLLFLNSDLQIESAMKIVESNRDEVYSLAIAANLSFDLVHNVLTRILPFIELKGLKVNDLRDQRLLNVLLAIPNNFDEQKLFNSLIIAIIKPSIPVEQIISQFKLESVDSDYKSVIYSDTPPEEVTSELFIRDEKQQRINNLLQITNKIKLEDAIKLVEMGFDKIFGMSISIDIPLILVLNVLIKYIPAIKAEGFDIQSLNHQRILSLFEYFKAGLLKEDQIYDCLTIAVILPDKSIEKIISNDFSKAKVRAIKIKELERIEQDIKPLPIAERVGYKIGLVKDNCYIWIYRRGRVIGESEFSISISVDELKYFLSHEIDLPDDYNSAFLDLSAQIIQKALKNF